jgi:hypothetical protein
MGCFLYNKHQFTHRRCKIFPLEGFLYWNTRPVFLVVWIVFSRSCEIHKSCVPMALTSSIMYLVFLVFCLGTVSCYNCENWENWNCVITTHIYLPMKMEQTECSEISAFKLQTPGNYPKESIQFIEFGESLKSRKLKLFTLKVMNYYTGTEN